MFSKQTSDSLARETFPSPEAGRFGRRLRRERGYRIPITLVTGFLGAGKTTLIKHFLSSDAGARTAIIVNEFGEVGIDHTLLRASSDNTVLMGNGCLCCSLRTDLEVTLRELLAQAATGAVPGFDRVIVETSGLADPGPVLQTFAADRGIGGEFHLETVVTLVDAATAEATLASAPEAARQVALADRLLISKADLVEDDAVDRLRAMLAERNPSAEIRAVDHGATEAGVLTRPSGPPREISAAHAHHASDIASFSLTFDTPVAWPAFSSAMDALIALRGPDLLRVKGLLAVKGSAGPVVIHVVQHVPHPPVELQDWPDDDRRGRLVFIARRVQRDQVAALFDAVVALSEDRSGGPSAPVPH
jgi:G3E family GTPase